MGMKEEKTSLIKTEKINFDLQYTEGCAMFLWELFYSMEKRRTKKKSDEKLNQKEIIRYIN